MNSILLQHYDFFVNDKIAFSESDYIVLVPNKNILFVKSGETIISINIESIYFTKGEYKEHLCELFSGKKIIIPDYKTASLYLNTYCLNEAVSVENLCTIKNDETKIFEYTHSCIKKGEVFELIDFLDKKYNEYKNLNEIENTFFKNLKSKDIATHIISSTLVYANSDLGNMFVKHGDKFIRKIQYSNKRAVTGRIICTDKFDIHRMEKTDERRKSVISRFNKGHLVTFDYTSFETTLAMFLTNNKKFIEENINKDLHEETAKIIFKEDAPEGARKLGKNINHAIIFGAGRETVLDILNDIEDKNEIYKSIIDFFQPIMSMGKTLQKDYERLGFIVNYFGSFVYPNKDYALYNNYIQSTAADIITKKLLVVNEILKNYKSKILTAIHDSIIVDFHPDEEFLIDVIKKEMESEGDFHFNVSCKKTISLFAE